MLGAVCLLPRPRNQVPAGGAGACDFHPETPSWRPPSRGWQPKTETPLLKSLTSPKKHWRPEKPTSVALHGFVMGWEAPSLPKGPVFSFMAALLQPLNRQIVNELECCKNIHIVNVYLAIDRYLEHSQWPAASRRAWVTLTLGQRKGVACLGLRLEKALSDLSLLWPWVGRSCSPPA